MYNIFPLMASAVMFYALTRYLAGRGVITALTHRRVWNAALLASFAITAVSGFLLVIRVNYGWSPRLPFNMLYWHVEAGVVMSMVCLFHIREHWRCFSVIFKNKKEK